MLRVQKRPRSIACATLVILLLMAGTANCAELTLGKAVSIDSQSGEWDSGSRFCPSVVRDDAGYRMYYSGWSRAEMSESTWGPVNIGLATSKDGVGWSYRNDVREPVLYSTPFREGDVLDPDEMAKRFDSVWATGPCVIKDTLSSSKGILSLSKGVYKMWYTGWTGDREAARDGVTTGINHRIGYATSKDGVKWAKRSGKAGAGSVIGLGKAGASDSKGAGQPWVLISTPPLLAKEGAGGSYRMWYEGYDGKTWRICYAESADGVIWTKRGPVLEPGKSGSLDEMGSRNPVVVKRGERYEMWYQGLSASEPRLHVLRAVSLDGTSWTKLPGEIDLLAGSPLNPGERLHVDSVLAEPDGSYRVFFARENATTREVTLGIVQNKRWAVYTEVVKP